MPAAHDRPGHREAPPLPDDDGVIDVDLAADDGLVVDAAAGGPADGMATATLRSRLAVVAGFLALFHLAFAAIKITGPAAGTGFTSDASASSLLLRSAAAGLVFTLVRSSLPLGRRQLRLVEGGLFGFEMLLILATQYLSVIDLIDRRDLIDAVAIQKNGVIRTLVLMICSGVFLPRAPAVTARIVVTMAAAIILCHGVVLHHADTIDLDRNHVASHQIVMANALFLIAGVGLATLAARVLRGRDGDRDGAGRVGAYPLLRKLDEGGAGEVYLAEHDMLRRPCAVKLV
jgi:serine/threonine-protein kinase